MRRHLLLLGILLLPGVAGAGGLPVFDGALNALGVQQQWVQLKELYESIAQTANQARQIENQVRQITGVYTQVDQGIRNLARLDIDNITDLYGMLNQLQANCRRPNILAMRSTGRGTRPRASIPASMGC